ncbi:MAG: hypothetical protein IT548_05805 [Alphaproteobacteria bacterium]|nr:hypothetical protein [Alphaproteobacteria bacterium]
MITLLVLMAGCHCLKDVETQFPVLRRDTAIVEDAKRRWLDFNYGNKKALKNVIPIVVHMFEERCVILHPTDFSIGAQPVYCYNMNEDTLSRVDLGGE